MATPRLMPLSNQQLLKAWYDAYPAWINYQLTWDGTTAYQTSFRYNLMAIGNELWNRGYEYFDDIETWLPRG